MSAAPRCRSRKATSSTRSRSSASTVPMRCASMDGAGRFRKMLHITVPELIPTYLVLLLLSIAGILNNGMEQYLVFENATNTDPIMVLDLYVYKLGIDRGVIPLSTVIGMVKSIVSVTLLFGANAISKAIRGTSIV